MTDRIFTQNTWVVDGLSLNYKDYAVTTDAHQNAPEAPILCLHGLTRNSRDFDNLINDLPANARIIVPEQRGRGRSDFDKQPENYHLWQYVNDTLQLLNTLEIDHCHIIGTSMGGLMAMIMFEQQPSLIGSLVLNDIGPELSSEGLSSIANSLNDNLYFDTFEQAISALKTVLGDCYPNFSERQWQNFTQQLYIKNGAGQYYRDYDPAISINATQGLDSEAKFDLWPLFSNLASSKKPLLLIAGGLSNLLEKATIQKMQTVAPHMALYTIDDCGHAPLLTEALSIEALKEHFEPLGYC